MSHVDLTRVLLCAVAIIDRPEGVALERLDEAIRDIVARGAFATASPWCPLLAQAARILSAALIAGDEARAIQAAMIAGTLKPLVEADRDAMRAAPPLVHAGTVTEPERILG